MTKVMGFLWEGLKLFCWLSSLTLCLFTIRQSIRSGNSKQQATKAAALSKQQIATKVELSHHRSLYIIADAFVYAIRWTLRKRKLKQLQRNKKWLPPYELQEREELSKDVVFDLTR